MLIGIGILIAPMIETLGRLRLTRALSRPGVTQTLLAERCAAAQSTVSGWAAGAFRPDALQREILARLLGIATRAWLTAEERERLRHLRRVRPRPVTRQRRERSAGRAR